VTAGSRIRQLDASTVSRIAAGEVVERPASVVKELAENAIDAGATDIDIRITSRQGQITGITITDDGCGMNHDDARMAFTRHATSKIRGLPDLFSCTTLGFRGEALASIAAVSRVTIVTREKGGETVSGTLIINEGGKIVEDREAGCPDGTSVSVEKIFYNTPARRKFQRSLPAEIAVISGMVERLVLTHPGIAFHLTHNGREKIAVPGSGGLTDAIIHLFGLEIAGQLLHVDTGTPGAGIRGAISVPDLSRKNPYQMYLSVNSRPVFSRNLVAAIKKAYGTLLPQDRYPVVFLDLAIPVTEVDINVHPTKREVRFGSEEQILATVTDQLRAVLESHRLIPEKDASRAAGRRGPSDGSVPLRYISSEPVPDGVKEPLLRERITMERQLRLTEAEPAEPAGGRIPDLEIIGQFGALYLICRTPDDDLLLIDQHAAHERILYEQIGKWPSFQDYAQELIEPVILTLSPREAEMLIPAIPTLEEEGFSIEPFGIQAWAVRTVPVTLGRQIDPETVREIIAELIAPWFPKGVDRAEHLRRIVACRGALKGGTQMTPDQCEQLILQLRRTKNPFTCPHGRPTMVFFSKKKLDELFGRT
jgi:DNA mismatch repair protein MutL